MASRRAMDDAETNQIRRSRDGGLVPETTRPDPADSRPEDTEVEAAARVSTSFPGDPLGASRQYGRYELLMELASGGMATLYLARLTGPVNFEKHVAIKIIHPHLSKNAKFVTMFFDEARISALIEHPNCVQIFDLGSVAHTHFIAMEYVRGCDYRHLLTRISRDPDARDAIAQPRLRGQEYWAYGARIVAEVAAGLHAAHELRSQSGEELGLVHRDVTPHNVLISYDGHVKLTDFGIAYAKHRLSHTDSGTLKGKLGYMSPEQAEGLSLDRRADIFSLGVVLWEALTLKRLFRRETDTATLAAVSRGDVPAPRVFRPDLPEDLEAVVMRALARDPNDRFQTAQEMHRGLEEVLAQHEVVVGAAEVGEMMMRLFGDEKAELDARIKLANSGMLGDLMSPVSGPPVEGATQTRLSAEIHRAVSSGRPRTLTNLLLAAVIVLLAVGGGYFLFFRAPADNPGGGGAEGASPSIGAPDARAPVSALTPDAAVKPPAPMPPPKPRLAGKLLVTFEVKPKRARPTIHFRGQQYQQDHLDIPAPPGKTTELVRVEAPGYRPIERYITVREGAKLQHEFVLQPVPRRWVMRPTPMARRPPPMRDMGYMAVDIGLDD